MLVAIYTLWIRDIVRFYRQRSRIIGALGTPVVFWILLGSGLRSSFRADTNAQVDYLEYFYPGTLVLILLFTAIFSTISVIEDRQTGFLQGVLVAPIPRISIVIGKTLGGTTLACGQAGLFLLLAPLANASPDWNTLPTLVLVLSMFAFGLTGLGFVLAWWLDSTQGFHAIMNLLLVPMWLLSGAVFPAYGASKWIQNIMLVNPMTYGVSAVRSVLAEGASGTGPSLATSLLVLTAFGIAMLIAGAVSVQTKKLN